MNQVVKTLILIIVLALIGWAVWFFVPQNADAPGDDGVSTEEAPWETYRDDDLSIAFEYPSMWALTTFGGGGSTRYLTARSSGFSLEINDLVGVFSEDLGRTNRYLHIVGIEDDFFYPEDVPLHWAYDCPFEHKDIQEFCQDGCERVSKDTAFDYRFGSGRSFTAMAYTNISDDHPSACFQIGLWPLQVEIAEGEGVSPIDVSLELLRSRVRERQVRGEYIEILDDFERIVKSIREI